MKNLTRRTYSGIRQRNVNEVVWNIYGYKYFHNEDCFETLVKMAIEDLQDYDFDIIIPIKPRNSGSDIVIRIASRLADYFKCTVHDCLNSRNNRNTIKDYLKNQNVLIVDDVYFTGKTANKAYLTIKGLRPDTLSFYAIAKSNTK